MNTKYICSVVYSPCDRACLHLQEALELDGVQIQMAKSIWQGVSQELAILQAEREAILQSIRQQDMQPVAPSPHASLKAAALLELLEQVSQLTKNATLQHEVLRHASCLMVWQICSPDTMARAMCHSWPAFPDLLGILKAMAGMSME